MKTIIPYGIFEEYSDNKIYSGKYVADHIRNITPEESDIPDYSIVKDVLPNKFVKKQIIIKNLLDTDKYFKEYYDSGEERYDQDDVSHDELDYPVVVVDGIVVDGYSRLSHFLRNGIEDAVAFVNVSDNK